MFQSTRPTLSRRSNSGWQGLSLRDLEAMLGPRAGVAEILNRKGSLSIAMIRRLHEGLGISAEVLIRKTAKADAA